MKKVLIIQTAFIGDAILATALLEKFASYNQTYVVDFLVRRGNESLFTNNPHLRRLYIWNKRNKYRSLIGIIKSVRKEKYDLVVNLQRYFSTGLITALSGAALKVGYKKNPLSRFFDRRHPHPLGEGPHEIERNMLLIQEFTDSEPARPKLFPSEQDYAYVKKDVPYITISPSSVWFTKQFPREKWIEFLDRVDDRIHVFLLGGGGDKEACEYIRQGTRHKNTFNMAGAYSFLQSAALMEYAKMNYVNDSAPLHLCSAVNAPVVAIFCSTVPEFGFTPLSDVRTILEVSENPGCRPCGFHGKKVCPQGHFKCADIPVSRLVSALD